MANPGTVFDKAKWDSDDFGFDRSPIALRIVGIRRTEQSTSNSGKRAENLRAEVTTPNVGRRIDE